MSDEPSSVYSAPAAVVETGQVVDQIPPHDRPRLRAEEVDRPQVAEEFAAEIVDVVLLDEVLPAGGVAVAPGPADRDAGVGA